MGEPWSGMDGAAGAAGEPWGSAGGAPLSKHPFIGLVWPGKSLPMAFLGLAPFPKGATMSDLREADILRMCLSWLHLEGVYCWR